MRLQWRVGHCTREVRVCMFGCVCGKERVFMCVGGCSREAWIGSALILTAQCHTRCNATPTLPHSVFEQAHTYTHIHTHNEITVP